MGNVVEMDCEKSLKLETSPKVTKSKRSLHWCRSISDKLSAHFFITVSVKKLLARLIPQREWRILDELAASKMVTLGTGLNDFFYSNKEK